MYVNSFKDLSGVPTWAKNSLDIHKYDIRPYIYSTEELENAKIHDKLWNSTQIQLIREGTIHGYLRMYWAKKILEWTISPDEALKIAIYLLLMSAIPYPYLLLKLLYVRLVSLKLENLAIL